MRELAKKGPILSLIGGAWMFGFGIVLLLVTISQWGMWGQGWPHLLLHIFYIVIGAVAIIGVRIKFRHLKVGTIILLITGLFSPVYGVLMEDPAKQIAVFIISIILLFIGGIVGFIEWLVDRNNPSEFIGFIDWLLEKKHPWD